MKTSSGCLLLLCLLPVIECGNQNVIGFAGQSITLPCKYDIKYHGRLSVCWGRGAIPTSGCADQIITFDGSKVTEELKPWSRYQLLGRLDAGDVSLTILNAKESDSGSYGCRVMVVGWFNDKKYNIDLTIKKAPESTTSTASDNVTEEMPSNHTQDHMNATEYWNTSSSPPDSRAEGAQQESSSDLPVVLVCVLFAVVALITTVAVFVIAKRWGRLNKILHIPHPSSNLVRFSSSVSSRGLHSRETAVENVYQIEEADDYESFP